MGKHDCLLLLIIIILPFSAYPQDQFIVGENDEMVVYESLKGYRNWNGADFSYKINIPTIFDSTYIIVNTHYSESPISGINNFVKIQPHNMLLFNEQITELHAYGDYLGYDIENDEYLFDTLEIHMESYLIPKVFSKNDVVDINDTRISEDETELYWLYKIGLEPRGHSMINHFEWIRNNIDKYLVYKIIREQKEYFGWIKMDLSKPDIFVENEDTTRFDETAGDTLLVYEIAVPREITRPYTVVVDTFFCVNDSVFINNRYINEEGFYNDSLIAENGADSIVSYKIDKKSLPKVNLGRDTAINICDTLNLEIDNSLLYYTWNTGKVNEPLTIGGCDAEPDVYEYIVEFTDSNFCTNSDTISITIKNNLNTQAIDFPDPEIFPNLGLDYIYIRCKRANKYKIMDATGRIIKLENVKELNSNLFKVNIADLLPGVYLLYLQYGENKFIHYKIVKQ